MTPCKKHTAWTGISPAEVTHPRPQGAAVWFVFALVTLLLAACAPPENSRFVTLTADGETRTLTTEALTVRDLLVEAGVVLDENDYVTPAETSFIESGMAIRVVRVDVYTETEQRDIPFERQTVRDASIPVGETSLLQAGITGLEELTYRITLEDGIEIERRLVRRVALQESRAEVILVGVQPELKPVPITGTVAYVVNWNAWVMQTSSANQRRLTHTGDLDVNRVFSLSSDGSYLLFTRAATETGETAPLNTLWMIETATAGAQPVRLDVDSVLWADLSPQCQGDTLSSNCRIAYTTGVRDEGNPGWKAENDLWVAWPRASDGRLSSKRRVVEPSAGGPLGWWGTTYAWSPDGTRLAYARADEVGTIRVSGGAPALLANFPSYRTYAAWVWTPTISWSPEGDFIIATLHGPSPTGEAPEDSPVFDVWALAANGTITAELVSEVGMWAAPTYAPAGDAVIFNYARSPYNSQTSGYDLYVMDRDGSDRQQLFPPEGEIGLEYHPAMTAWGPGGNQVIVVYQGNLYLIHLPDGATHQLTTEGNVTAVRWRW